MKRATKRVSHAVRAEAAADEPADKNTFWTCWSVSEVIRLLPNDVDEAREVLRIATKLMAMKHGDRWKYTAEEYAQHLKGKNPHGLGASTPRVPAKRGTKR
jgi:hypothetical protein